MIAAKKAQKEYGYSWQDFIKSKDKGKVYK